MTARRWASIDDAIREVEDLREEAMQRPLPYREIPIERVRETRVSGELLQCPVHGCRQTRSRYTAVESHLEVAHDVRTARELENLNVHLAREEEIRSALRARIAELRDQEAMSA